MSENKMITGEVPWGNTFADNKGKLGRDSYLRLQSGSNVVRILTSPCQYYQHQYKPEGGRSFGYRVNCSAANGSCQLCEQGDKAKKRWMVGVIDRKTGMYRVLDMSFGIFKGIQTLNSQTEDWGSPLLYDLDIVVNPNGGPMGYYSVVPKPKRPLSAADLVIQAENDVAAIVAKTAAPTLEQMQKRMDKIHEEIKAAGGVVVGGSSASLQSSEEEDFFPDHKTNSKASF